MSFSKYPLRDAAGNIIKPGLLQTVKEWKASDDIPAWLTFVAATTEIITPDVGVPGIKIFQPGAPFAEIRPGGNILRDENLIATSLRVSAVTSLGVTNYNEMYLNLDNDTSTSGVLTLSEPRYADSYTRLIARGTGVSDSIYFTGHRLYRNLVDANLQATTPPEQVFRAADYGLMVNWQQKMAYVFQGNTAVGKHDISLSVTATGVLTPRIRFRANTLAPVLVSGVRLDNWYY